MRISLAFTLALLALLLVNLEEIDAGRRRRSPTPSKSRSHRVKPSKPKHKPPTKSRKPKVIKPKVYKDTYMPARTYNSPVIVKQTIYKSKSSKFPKYLAAGVAGGIAYYTLTRAPVYRGYYPMYGSYLRVPRDRGIRVVEEKKEIVNRYTNERCYRVETTVDPAPPSSGAEENKNTETDRKLESPVNSTTTVEYDDGEKEKITGKGTITLEENKLDKNFTAVTVTDYGGDIPNTKISGNCTRVVTTTRASMIRVYESNPYANAAFVAQTSSCVLVFTLVALSFKLLR